MCARHSVPRAQGRQRKTAPPCHFLYPRSLKSLDLCCLSSSLSIASDERPSTNADDRAAGLCLCYDNLYGIAGSAINRSHLADIPYVVDHVYRVGFLEEYQECMARGYFENVAFRLPSQAIIVSITPYEARTASLCEGYAEFYPWNRAHHSFIEIFNGLYETSVPEYCAGALVFFDCYTLKF